LTVPSLGDAKNIHQPSAMATDTDAPSSESEEQATISPRLTKPSTKQLVAWEYAADQRAASTPADVHNVSVRAILDEGVHAPFHRSHF
jgi:hypothetical protein